MPFSAPLWVLYSSGTTGLPKPIVQSVGGILLEHLKSLRLHWDLGPGDRFLWFTTTGWMMWNFLIGGLLVGATVVLYDGSPGHPDLMSLWRVAERHRVDHVRHVRGVRRRLPQGRYSRPATTLDLTALRHHRLDRIPVGRQRFRLDRGTRRGDVQIVSFSGGTDLCTGHRRRRPDRPGVEGRDLLPRTRRPGRVVLPRPASRCSTRSASW